MAENFNDEVLLRINYDTSSAEQSLDTLGTKLAGVGNKDIGESTVKSFKQQLKEATNAALALQTAGKMDTKEYSNAVKVIAQLKDEQDVLNRTVSAFDPGNKFNAFVGISRTAASTVQGIAGAMSVLGVNSETATETLARLQGIMAFTDTLNQLGDLGDFWKGFILQLKSAKTVTDSVATATKGQTVATTVQTAATTGLAGATQGATVAAKGLGLAWKAMGIGLIISAVALLVTYWDDIKNAMNGILPAGKSVSNMFDNIKSMAMGVANTISQYILTPFKAVTALLSGDLAGFKKAIAEGLNFKANFNSAYDKQELVNINNQNKKKEILAITDAERTLQRSKNLGNDIDKQEIALAKRKLATMDKTSKAYAEQKLLIEDLEDRHQNKLSTAQKAASDKAAAARKTANDKAADDLKKQKELELANRKEAAKYINEELLKEELKHISKLDAAKKILQAQIDERAGKAGLTADQKVKIRAIGKSEMEALEAQSKADMANLNARTNTKLTENENAPNENDSEQVAVAKIKRIAKSKLDEEKLAFETKAGTLKGQGEELAALQAEHEGKMLDITKASQDAITAEEKKASDKRKAIAEAEQEAKEALADAAFNMADNLGNLLAVLGEKNKGLAIAGVVVDQASSIAKIIMNTMAANAMALKYGVLAPPIIAMNNISAGLGITASIAAGANAIKSINSGTAMSGSVSGGATPSYSAVPQINSTVLQDANNVQDVRLVNSRQLVPDTITAVISDRNLEKQKKQSNYKNKLSSF